MRSEKLYENFYTIYAQKNRQKGGFKLNALLKIIGTKNYNFHLTMHEDLYQFRRYQQTNHYRF